MTKRKLIVLDGDIITREIFSIHSLRRNGSRGGSKTAATSKMECFVIIVNGFQPLTIITKCSILDVAAVLDPPLVRTITKKKKYAYKRNDTHLDRDSHIHT